MADTSETSLGQAAELLLAGQPAQARALLARYLRTHPESAEGWYLLSHTITDAAQQRDCLERALRLDPGHNGARERLTALNSGKLAAPQSSSMWPPPPPPDAPSQTIQTLRSQLAANEAAAEADAPKPKAKPQPKPTAPAKPKESPLQLLRKVPAKWVRYGAIGGGVVVALVLCVGSALVYGPALLVRLTPTSTFTPTVTPILFPTLPPEWTPTPLPSPTTSPSPTATRTPTPTPTFPPPDATMGAEMDVIAAQVAELRQLEIMRDTPRFLVSRGRVQEVLAGIVLQENWQADLRDEARVLAALGLVPPNYDMVQYVLNHAADSVGGFYVPDLRQMFVIGDAFGGVERFVFSHEMTHALQDQHFDLDALGFYPYCTSNAQQCDAIRALIEGDATLVMGQWLDQFASPQDFQDITAYEPPDQTVPEASPPPYIAQDLRFPYDYGTAFVTVLYERGNWAEVNAAYADLPTSTEQILHPEKYLAGEAPVTVNDRPLSESLAEHWRELRGDVLGEWMTYLLLGYGVTPEAQQLPETALAAAAGWGGDSYQVYYDDGADATVMAVHWVWDSQADADEFLSALLAYQAARFEDAQVQRDDGDCWETGGQASCVFTAGIETLWLLAPNQTFLNQVLALYPSFQ